LAWCAPGLQAGLIREPDQPPDDLDGPFDLRNVAESLHQLDLGVPGLEILPSAK
jgi:hypothetical protein